MTLSVPAIPVPTATPAPVTASVDIVHVGGPRDGAPPFYFLADPQFVAGLAEFPRPVYAVAPARDAGTEPIGRLYGDAVLAHQDSLERHGAGGFHLGGFCVTGLVALEAAHRLFDLGRTVDFLALVDTVSPDICPPGTPKLVDVLGYQLCRDERVRAAAARLEEQRAVRPLTPRELLDSLDGPIRGAAHHLIDAAEDEVDARDRSDLADEFEAFFYMAMSGWDYRERPYPGPIAFIHNTVGLNHTGYGIEGILASRRRWQRITKDEYEVLPVDSADQGCPHLDMLHVLQVRAYLREKLGAGAPA